MIIAIQNTIGAIASSFNANFDLTVNTALAGSANNKFQLPLISSGTISIVVNWGDGSTDNITSFNQSQTLHEYSSSGVYNISIKGEVKGWRFNNSGDKDKIINISNWGQFNFTNNNSFFNCSNLTSTATDKPIISSLNLEKTFRQCSNFNGDISDWDVSSVTKISNMFKNCINFNQDLSNWDIRNVTNMDLIMEGVTLSTANYDALLIGWEDQEPEQDCEPNFGNSKFTAGGAAETARNSLTSTYGWTITDGGTA